MNKKNLIRYIFAQLFVLIFISQSVLANITSYTYSKVDNNTYWPFISPNPYNYHRRISAEDLGVDSLVAITSLFVTDDYLYISAGSQVIIADYEFNTQRILTSFIYNDNEIRFSEIDGIFVTDDGELYVCEPSAGRIVHFDADFNVVRILGRPEGIILNENVAWQPKKVAVDSVGRIYIIANNIYEGIVELNVDGSFSKYFGKVDVKYSVVDLFWRSIQTRAQRAASSNWLPVNFSNLVIDSDDFVYATVAGDNEREPIRKLNSKGASILRYPASTEITPNGDILFNSFGRTVPVGMSLITALDVNDYGVYVVLDTKRNRLFAYDDDGHLLYAFGSWGTTKGNFQNPVDVKYMGNKIIVADRGSRSIEVYELSSYGTAIHEASRLQYLSDYRGAAEQWRKVLSYNQNFQYANVGIGKALYREGDYENALEYFLLGQDVEYYSMTYRKVRKNFIDENFAYFALGITAAVCVYFGLKIYKKTRKSVKKGGVAT